MGSWRYLKSYMIIVFMTITIPVCAPLNSSESISADIIFDPAAVDIRNALSDPNIDTPPNVFVNGDSGNFSSSYFQSTGADSYVNLQWFHTAGTSLSWVDDWNTFSAVPACYDFIYFTQEFEWDSNDKPNAAYLNLSLSVDRTGDFNTTDGESMFSIYVWLIDSSGNWGLVHRSRPPYSDELELLELSLNYNVIHNAWDGMIEDSSGIQEDPSDTLTLAIGLAPTDQFLYYEPLESNPWNEYNGSVSAKIMSVNLICFMKLAPELDEILYPLVNNTWGLKIHDIFFFAPESYEHAADLCQGMVTGDDSSIYILSNSFFSYEMQVETGQSFRYLTLVKYDSQLNLIWVRTHRNMTYGYDIYFRDGFIYTTGSQPGEVLDDLLLTKWDIFGNIVWDTTWDSGVGECGGAVGVTDEGSIYVLVERSNFASPEPPYWLNSTFLKFSSFGVLEWELPNDYVWYCTDMEIEVAPNGLYTSESFLLYRDLHGGVQWTLSVNHTPPNGFPVKFTVDSNGNLYYSNLFGTETGVGIQFIKTDVSGTVNWNTSFTISYPGGWDERLECLTMSVAPDGSLIAYVGNSWLSLDHYIVKFSSEGVYQWHKVIGDGRWWYYPQRGWSFLNVAPNGVAYLAISMHTALLNTDVGIFSYDVGVDGSYPPPLNPILILTAGIGVIVVSVVFFKKRFGMDYFKDIKKNTISRFKKMQLCSILESPQLY